MKPIGWTTEWVRLRCVHCGAANELAWGSFFTALEHGTPRACESCGIEQVVEDRRQISVPVERERRLV